MAEAAIALLSKVSRVVYRLLDGVSKVFDTTCVVMFVGRNVNEQVPWELLVRAYVEKLVRLSHSGMPFKSWFST